MFDMFLQQGHYFSFGELSSVEIDLGGQVEPVKPDPFRSIVIAIPMRNFGIRRVIAVVVEGQIKTMILRQSSNANRLRSDEMLFYFLQVCFRMMRLTKLRSHC